MSGREGCEGREKKGRKTSHRFEIRPFYYPQTTRAEGKEGKGSPRLSTLRAGRGNERLEFEKDVSAFSHRLRDVGRGKRFDRVGGRLAVLYFEPSGEEETRAIATGCGFPEGREKNHRTHIIGWEEERFWVLGVGQLRWTGGKKREDPPARSDRVASENGAVRCSCGTFPSPIFSSRKGGQLCHTSAASRSQKGGGEKRGQTPPYWKKQATIPNRSNRSGAA